MGDDSPFDGLIAYIDFKFVNDVLAVRSYPIVDATQTFVMYNNGTISEIDAMEVASLLDDMILEIYVQGMGYKPQLLPSGSIVYNGQKASYSIGG